MKKKLFITILILSFALLYSRRTYAADWPMHLYDVSHSSNQNAESFLTTGNIAQVTKLWSFKTGGVIAAQPVISGSTVYVGSWDGNMYAFNRDTGVKLWSTFLGITTNPAQGCFPSKAGVTAAAQVYNGVLYVAGGDQFYYALNPLTGSILWKTQIYTSKVQGDYYNYGTAAIATVKGVPYVYVGLSSLCDNPLVHGQLLKINLNTHAIDGTFNVVPANGSAGGGIWSTPAIDTSVTPPVLYVTTGTPNAGQIYSKALLAINADTMQVSNFWQVPDSETSNTPDPDFGSSPTLFTSNGTKMVVAGHKNGKLYALNMNNLSAGPVWKVQIAIAGQCPQCGEGTISTSVFDSVHNLLYAAGGKDPNNTSAMGEVRAIDPATGTIKWTHDDLNGAVIADMVYTNGVLMYVNTSKTNTLVFLDASNGTVLLAIPLLAGAYSSPSVSNGIVFAADTSGMLWSFHVPGLSPTPTPSPTNTPTPTIISPTPTCLTVPPGVGTVTSTINIPQTNTYAFWGRMMSQDAQSNAFYLQTDGGCAIDVGDMATMSANTWTWVNYQNGNPQSPILLNLTAGQHTVTFSGNKPNVKLDNAIVTTDLTCIPVGTGSNCSQVGITPTPSPAATNSAYFAEYFANPGLTGTPSATRFDPEINFNWNGGSPDSSIPNTQFSARWTGTRSFSGGEYLFSVTSDDGARMFIDGTKVLDAWYDQPPTTYSFYQQLTPGNHTIIVEYYQNTGGDVIQVSYQSVAGTPAPTAIPTPVPAPPGQFSAEYFSNPTLSGTPTLTRVDQFLNFNWNGKSPDPSLPNNHFSARWTSTQSYQNRQYTFSVTSDDGARLYIDGVKVLDAWIDQPPTTYVVQQNMTAGNHTIIMEYYQATGGDVVQLSIQ